MDQETLLRKKIHALRTLYTNIFIYTVVCLACIIIWVSMGGGPFWPIWVIFGCALSAVLQAVGLGQIPQLHELFPFLNPSWEEEQINAQLGKTTKQHHPKTEPTMAPAKVAPVKKAAPKKVVQKKTPKK